MKHRVLASAGGENPMFYRFRPAIDKGGSRPHLSSSRALLKICAAGPLAYIMPSFSRMTLPHKSSAISRSWVASSNDWGRLSKIVISLLLALGSSIEEGSSNKRSCGFITKTPAGAKSNILIHSRHKKLVIRILEHHTNLFAQICQIALIHFNLVKRNTAGGCSQHANKRKKKSGLSRAIGSDQKNAGKA